MLQNISYKWQFIGSLLIVSIVAITGFVSLSVSYHNRLDRIVEIQREDCHNLSRIFNDASFNKQTIAKETENLSKSFEKHEEKMQSIMEMEFERLQNDFNFISLWAGLITIVFLIFSIYSIFKTDEMLKKSDIVYDEIKGKSDVIDNFTRNIQRKYKVELRNLKKESDDYIKELTQKISILNERLVNVDQLIKNIKDSSQIDEVVQASSEGQDTQEPIELL